MALLLGAPEHVRATVADALGREVLVVLDGGASGSVRLNVDMAQLAPGVYVVRVAVASFAETHRLNAVQ
jgi:TctA family transporter